MFFVLSIFNAGSSRILFAALSKSLKQMPSEGESKNEIIESVSAARNMMEAWALCPRLWEDWPQLIGQFLAAALQFRHGHQVSLQIQVPETLTRMTRMTRMTRDKLRQHVENCRKIYGRTI